MLLLSVLQRKYIAYNECVLTAEAQMYITVAAEREIEAAIVFGYVTCLHSTSPEGHKVFIPSSPTYFPDLCCRME